MGSVLPFSHPVRGEAEPPKLSSQARVAVLLHCLRVAGLGKLLSEEHLIASVGDGHVDIERLAADGAAIIVLDPAPSLLGRMGIEAKSQSGTEWRAVYSVSTVAPSIRLRGFGDIQTFSGENIEAVVTTPAGEALWAWRPIGRGGVLLAGSDIAGDIVKFRQGDPCRVVGHEDKEGWGYAGERPNYLYDGIVNKSAPHDRPCDWLVFSIADLVVRKIGFALDPVLPNGASCALVITGDTDGATAEHYSQQRKLLGDLPITYFLRPACAAPPAVLRDLDQDPRVDLQLHPDALEQPDRYGDLLDEQVRWFTQAVGHPPAYVRNHGYLNDGYWRHASHWLRNHISWSANLPGVDGLVLNGSLLPGRLVLNDDLKSHWSLVTPYGDGMMFALGLAGEEAGQRIEDHVNEILESKLPGVVTLNLHPANVASTAAMHDVLHRLTNRGALAWSMAQCARWFEQADAEL